MRVDLKSTTYEALVRMHTQCQEYNPSIEPSFGPFLSRLLEKIEKELSKEQWQTIAVGLTSKRVQKKRKLERLIKLSEKLNESDIERFEQKIERRSTAPIPENNQKSA